jgi:acyl-CoA synthetase (AMP-forming)/AMP-acid ligase II
LAWPQGSLLTPGEDEINVTEDPAVSAEPLRAILAASGSAALICPDDERSLSIDELTVIAEQLAGCLHGLGVRRGDRVAIVLEDGPELIELLFALSLLGAATAPLNPAYTTPEYEFFLGDLKPRLLLVPAGHAEAARNAAGSISVIDVLRRIGRHPMLISAGREARYEPVSDPGEAGDVALLLHTSGTTSRPKQVPLLQRNLVASARATARHYQLASGDVSYCAMPLFHVHGLIGSTLAQLVAGGSVVTPRRFTPSRFWSHARDYGVTWVSASPTFHRAILKHAGEPVETLRFARSCSSALSAELMGSAEEAYRVPLLQAYGMTEASHQMTSNPLPPGPRKADSVGVSAGARVRVVDERWQDAAPGTAGEVVVAGPGLTPGYFGNPEANEASFRDGWFRTGDLGVLDDDHLFLRGRLKEMIIRGGENISPAEIDEVLLAHSAVSEAVCFGVEDEKYGQVVEAAVVLAAGVTEQELRAHCRRSLAAFKVPGRIHAVDAIPRTPTGKVQRRLVASEIGGER